jgi:hypothetical protein
MLDALQYLLLGAVLMASLALAVVWSAIDRERERMVRLLEIKGLGADVKAIKAHIAGVKSVARDLNEETPKLRAEMVDLLEQVKEHRAGLAAEAGDLGNSSGEADSGEQQEITAPALGGTAVALPLQPGSDTGAAEPGR